MIDICKLLLFLQQNYNGGIIMATYTINLNERTNAGKALLGYLMSLGVISQSKAGSHYNPEYVAMIKKSQKEAREGKAKAIKTEDLWK